MEKLDELRKQIDEIDAKIEALISERARCAQAVAQVKIAEAKQDKNKTVEPPVFYRPEREAQVLRKVMERNEGPLDNEEMARLFREIMSACLALEQPTRVAYLGPEGTFTQAAAIKHFGHSAVTVPMSAIDEVFREGSRTLLAELANLKQIIGRFSDFAKMPAPEMQPVNLNALAGETMKLFEAQFAQARVTARVELAAELPTVAADAEQIARALRNLVLNAIDAMPEGGTLTVRTMPQGAGARIEIADTGTGLSQEECARLFTPYYTTKTHGTGLGLAIVQSVVSDHHGRITVESQPGKGTTFRIDLG